MATATISIKDIGPIQKLAIPVPKEGGVVVLRGPNGSGKTNALNATEQLLKRGKGQKPIEARDKTKRGEISGFGAQLNVARRNTCDGEVDVVSLEGRLDVSQVVDPGIKDAGAADAKRIKALLSLSGLSPDATVFKSLAKDEDEWLSVVDQSAIAPENVSDFVELADKIKRDFERAARAAEEKASNLSRQAQAKKAAADGVDTSDAKPAAFLLAEYNEANAKLVELTERQRLAERSRETHDNARTELQAAIDSYDGLSVEEAEESVKAHEANHAATIEDVRKAKAALLAAEQRASDAAKELGFANERYTAAKNHAIQLQGWRSAIESAAIEPVPEHELKEAKAAAEAAHAAMERGAIARKAKDAIEEAERFSELALEAKSLANRLRDAAKGTDDVLSSLVERVGSSLRVEGGRLVTQTDRRGATYFAELSAGERWKIALDIATDAVGETGLIVVPQEAWEGLDGANRKLVADHAKARRVVIITAEATKEAAEDQEIYAEVV